MIDFAERGIGKFSVEVVFGVSFQIILNVCADAGLKMIDIARYFFANAQNDESENFQ